MFKIGTTITLEPLTSESDEKYKCKIVELNENSIFIDYPINMKTEKTIFLIDGMQLRASFIGSDQCTYFFDTEVLGRVKQQIPMMILQYKGKDSLVRVQRRKFFRIEEAVDVAVESDSNEFPPFVSVTQDISAGGAAIILPEGMVLPSGSMIKALFVLPMQSGQWCYEKVNCKVIRTIIGENGNRNVAPLEFVNNSENMQQQFTRFCYEKQLLSKKLETFKNS